METKMLKFLYKGGRNYIHGTDMYMRFVDLLKELKPGISTGEIRMTIHKIIKNQCKLVYLQRTDGASRPADYKTEFIFNSESLKLSAWLLETDEPVTGRYEYDEDKIVRISHVEGKTIKINGKSPYSPIEIVVALNKHLHLTLFPDAGGKWLFTRLDLTRLLREEDSPKYSLNFIKNSHFRLTKSEIFAGNECIGNIYFSLLKK